MEATDRVWESRRQHAGRFAARARIRSARRAVRRARRPSARAAGRAAVARLEHLPLPLPPRRPPAARRAPRWRWHQDGGRQNVDVESRRPLFSVKAGWFLTDVTTPEHGALWIIPGSHVHDTLARPDNRVAPPGRCGAAARRGRQPRSLRPPALARARGQHLEDRPQGALLRVQLPLGATARRLGAPALAVRADRPGAAAASGWRRVSARPLAADK